MASVTYVRSYLTCVVPFLLVVVMMTDTDCQGDSLLLHIPTCYHSYCYSHATLPYYCQDQQCPNLKTTSSLISYTRRVTTPSIPNRKTTSTSTSLLLVDFVDKFFELVSNHNNDAIQPKTMIQLEASNIKVGALRFLLHIHLVGEQNNPIPNAWICREADEEEDPKNHKNVLNVYYQDGTAMLSIRIQENGITMIRYGTKPSLPYQIHESILIHNLLDEIQIVAFGTSSNTNDNDHDDSKKILPHQRLIQLTNDQVIERARSTLPIRKEG
jgi:hypothetical protein